MTARCALCRDEREYRDVALSTRCAACGAAKTLRAIRVDSKYTPTGRVDRSLLPALARQLEDRLCCSSPS